MKAMIKQRQKIAVSTLLFIAGIMAVGLVTAGFNALADKKPIPEKAVPTPTETEPATVDTHYQPKPGAPTNRASCEQQGGAWGRVGLSPQDVCNLTTADAGKFCRDAGDCQGACIAETIDTRPKCSAKTVVVGCFIFYGDGRGTPVCVD